MNMTVTYPLGHPALEDGYTQPRAGEDHQPRPPGTNGLRLEAEPVRSRMPQIGRSGSIMTSIWYWAMVGFAAAALIPPFSDGRSLRNRG
jgi:hypothetical protein